MPDNITGSITAGLSLQGTITVPTADGAVVTTGNAISGQIVGGPRGIQGIQGDTGDVGPQGPIGATGPQGPQGADSTVPGPAGPQGDTGLTGPTGPAGADSVVPGPTGPTGPAGPTGPTGSAGADGADGVDGTDGAFAGRTITGTPNQITVTNGDGVAGNPTLSTPQDIHTGASPTFAKLNLNGTAYLDGATAGAITIGDGQLLANDSNNTGGGIISKNITVKPNPGRGASASMFFDNTNGQVWEFFNNVNGSFGVYNTTSSRQPFTIEKTALADTVFVDNGIFRTAASVYPNADSTYTNGTPTNYWLATHTDRLYLNSTAYLDGATAGRMDAVGNFYINSNGQARLFSTRAGANSNGSNIFIGGGGQNSIGAVGQGWLGSSNVSLGVKALNALTTGDNNVALGVSALQANTTGVSNTAVGTNALLANTSGGGNMALGLASLQANTTGVNNLGIGVRALTANTTGYGNIALGEDAGRWLADGSTANQTAGNSIYIGSTTKASAAGGQNETVIGSAAIGNGSNTVTIGNSSITANYFSGNIESTTTSAGVILKSPDGTRYKVTVANGGTLAITAA